MKTPLPDKPSALLRLALDDLKLVEGDDRYCVAMLTWHQPFDGICHVCLAGAVLAKTCEIDPRERPVLSYFGDSIHRQLYAINDFRRGEITHGLGSISDEMSRKYVEYYGLSSGRIIVADYHTNRERFLADMESLISRFEVIDL